MHKCSISLTKMSHYLFYSTGFTWHRCKRESNYTPQVCARCPGKGEQHETYVQWIPVATSNFLELYDPGTNLIVHVFAF
jgi:hypothetical protein